MKVRWNHIKHLQIDDCPQEPFVTQDEAEAAVATVGVALERSNERLAALEREHQVLAARHRELVATAAAERDDMAGRLLRLQKASQQTDQEMADLRAQQHTCHVPDEVERTAMSAKLAEAESAVAHLRDSGSTLYQAGARAQRDLIATALLTYPDRNAALGIASHIKHAIPLVSLDVQNANDKP